MNVLVINTGSSSLKFQVIDPENEVLLAKGLCERIGIDGVLTYENKVKNTGKIKKEAEMKDHQQAIGLVLDALTDPENGVIASLDEIGAVGHRLVHGGEKYNKTVVITDDVVNTLIELSDLAPLHNPANVIGVNACKALMPNTPMVGVFDTAFHQTMPAKAYMYGLPYRYYENYKVRRYGFHGTSHKYVSTEVAKYLGKTPADLKTIVCHLGNGSSISAVKYGQCVDTTMGMTPIEGLIMGTRVGDLDFGIVEYIANKENLSIAQVSKILNKESGVYGLSNGLSSDFRDLWAGAKEGNEYAKLALEAFSYRVAKYIGAYAAAMNGVDVIAFTAGVGENDPGVREMVCEYLGYLGVELDKEANDVKGKLTTISAENSKVKVVLFPTDEELAIAKETYEVLKG